MCPCSTATLCPKARQADAPSLDVLTRREWVKRFALGTVAAMGAGVAKEAVLAEISPDAKGADLLSFKVSDYPVLQNDFGSLRFSIFGANVPNGIITITRAPGNVFHAVSAYCTHEGCIVEPFDPLNDPPAMICNCHVSVYDIQGRVVYAAGGASQPDLPAYDTDFSDGVVRVHIPGMNLGVKLNSHGVVSHNPGTGAKRIQLSFVTRNGARYRLLHSPNLTTAPTPVSFATTISGPANATFITGNSTTPNRSVWAVTSNPRGFYFVELWVAPY